MLSVIDVIFLLVSPGDAGPLYWLLITSVAYSVNERGIVIGDYNVLWVVVYERLKGGDPLCLFVHQIERGFGETYCSANLHTGVL